MDALGPMELDPLAPWLSIVRSRKVDALDEVYVKYLFSTDKVQVKFSLMQSAIKSVFNFFNTYI